jgi:hypothetical protein
VLIITSPTWAIVRLTSCLDTEITQSRNVRGMVSPPGTSAHATGHEPDHRHCGLNAEITVVHPAAA